nr:hypothetical protein [uncultured Rhodopila sp.]
MSADSPSLPLAGPAAINITAALPLFPRRHPPPLKPRSIVVINTSGAPVTIPRIDCDSVQETQSGVVADGMLEAAATTATLAAGESTTIVISGHLPSRAGAYVANLRIRTEAEPALVLPIAMQVAASPARGILCMLLGLAFVAIINMLQGESDVRARLASVNQFGQDTREWLDRNPQPASAAGDVEALERDVQRARDFLSGPRPRSFTDWRIARAQEPQRAAEETLKAIKDATLERTRTTHRPPDEAEVAELDDQWSDFRRRTHAAIDYEERLPGQTANNLAGRLAGFLSGFKTSYLDLTAQVELGALGTQIALVDLTLSAGQPVQARQQAIEARRWLERAAAEVNQRLRMVANYQLMASFLLDEDARIRDRLADPGLPDDKRQAIANDLDAATSGISAATSLLELKNDYVRLLEVGISLLRLRSQIMVADVQAAVQRADAEADDAPVSRAMSEDPPKPSDPTAVKIAFARRVLASWTGPLATVDPATRADMQARISEIDAVLERGELKATSPLFKGLMQAWTDYGLRHISEAAHAAAAAYCRVEAEDLRRRLTRMEANLRLVRDNDALPAWEAKVNQIAVRASAIPDGDCIAQDIRRKADSFDLETFSGSPMLALQWEANALSRTIFTASLADAPIGTGDRLKAAELSGVAEAIDLARASAAGQRSLSLRLLTPTDLYVGRPIQIQVEGLAQNWGAGVRIGLDFGDHTAPAIKSAEDALKQPFVHTYSAPLPVHTHVIAASEFQNGSLNVTGDRLGSGELSFDIGISPVSTALDVANAFFNARFGVALAIALLVYFWQFWTKEKTFGSGSLDYLKAFALGVAAEAAVANLPEVLANLAKG